jgi:hypothetical protein
LVRFARASLKGTLALTVWRCRTPNHQVGCQLSGARGVFFVKL